MRSPWQLLFASGLQHIRRILVAQRRADSLQSAALHTVATVSWRHEAGITTANSIRTGARLRFSQEQRVRAAMRTSHHR